MTKANDTCGVCGEMTPWYMPAVIVDDTWLCSPACARELVREMDARPETVALHDPQFATDIAEDAVDISRPTSSTEDAQTAIDEIAEMFPGDFRP